ncbi:C4-dicarboxylate ABC transporter substrate-binding protein [Oceanisphaera psychrotolerans]|uniref:TRAP transporter small permease protein n=2 Tax=Oceanisphaera psychrotolerans TaxID=1414654 RepID=A0A1J4QL35_9GAMM|nr:C4-dicarboxylate ABC transporter substrate-binding protein [Oceanisphaera psychrotolerans]
MAMVVMLVSSILYEVVSRYVFGAPTLWSFDISYMLNGALFLLASGYSLKVEAHVRIDFLSARLALRYQQLINLFFYFFMIGPSFFFLSYVAGEKAISAWVTGEVESVSPWSPLVWPFYGAIAIGLMVFTLQVYIDGIRYLQGDKTPGESVTKDEMSHD